MNKTMKGIFSITCVLAGLVSFLYLTMRNRDILGEYYAKSSVNVEIDKTYAENIALAVETSPNPCSYWMSPTTTGDAETKNIVMHISVPLMRPFWNPAIQFPEAEAGEALAAIDHIAVFVGNKLFYFSHDDVQKFRQKSSNGYILYYIPGIFYEKSFIYKNWGNYYGDINLGIKALTAFFLYPARFVPTWLCLFLLMFLYRAHIKALCTAAIRHKKISGIILLALIVFAGFVLRWNGYVRHSGWTDEIYSATRAGNPNLPLINTFTDPGNPPFYFILLRYWFKIFGWSEASGTMLSVLLGTLAIWSLYMFVKPFFGRKTAIYAALFVAFSGFAIGYSQEMRGYILKMFLVPLVSLAFLNFLKKPLVKNIVPYVLLSVCIVNTHYYGILLVMANFVFFIIWMLYNHNLNLKNTIPFVSGNILIALSFLPFFLYTLLEQGYDFTREFTPTKGHTFLFLVILIFIAAFFVFRKDIVKKNPESKIIKDGQHCFVAYLLLVPSLIFTLSYLISFFKPMIAFRYLWPVNAPFCFALAAVMVSCIGSQQKHTFVVPFAVYMFVVGLNGIVPDIPSGGTEAYKEARAYIAADALAHPHRKAAMLDNAPQNAAYYGFPNLPLYSQDTPVDVLYVYNDIFNMHEIEVYDDLRSHDINSKGLLKIYFDYDYPRGDGGMIMKKYFKE